MPGGRSVGAAVQGDAVRLAGGGGGYLAPWDPEPSGRPPRPLSHGLSRPAGARVPGLPDLAEPLALSLPAFALPGAHAPVATLPETATALPATREVQPPPAARLPSSIATHVPTSPRDRLLERFLETLPLAAAVFLISSLLWGALWLPLPLTFMLLAFDCYWVWRSYNTAFHCVKGYFRLRKDAGVDWRACYEEARAAGNAFLRWEDIRHVIIIPTYKESIAKLSASLSKLAESEIAEEQIFVVLAFEEAESGCRKKALRLYQEFHESFAAMFATFHPAGIPGEVKGKSSNEAWAGAHIKRKLVDEMGYDIDHLTVTSCDADTLFHPRYFNCLTHKFATHPQRYRRFWQAPVFLYNNIWDVPAPLRLPNALSTLNHLARLTRKYCVLFPQSTYSLSLRMADDVGYWDVDVVPEDWHMFLKCFFHLEGEAEVEPIFLPVGNDGVRSHSYLKTFVSHYEQARRHAWGVSDIPFAVRQFLAHPEIPLLRRLRRTWSLFENHLLWSSQWFLITVGRMVPAVAVYLFGVKTMPVWFDVASTKMLFTCILPLAVMVGLDTFMRPQRPRSFPIWLYPVQFAQWFLMAAVTFLFGALPALDAQARLALGKRLEYKVTEKA